MLGPLTFGLLAQTYSYSVAWLVGSTWYIVGAVAMLIGRRQMVRFRQEAALGQEEGSTT